VLLQPQLCYLGLCDLVKCQGKTINIAYFTTFNCGQTLKRLSATTELICPSTDVNLKFNHSISIQTALPLLPRTSCKAGLLFFIVITWIVLISCSDRHFMGLHTQNLIKGNCLLALMSETLHYHSSNEIVPQLSHINFVANLPVWVTTLTFINSVLERHFVQYVPNCLFKLDDFMHVLHAYQFLMNPEWFISIPLILLYCNFHPCQ
jgi:hypothetical protein